MNKWGLIWIAILIVTLLFGMGVKINLHPFKISFETPYLGFGVLVTGIGFSLLMHHGYRKGFKEAQTKMIDAIESMQEKQRSDEPQMNSDTTENILDTIPISNAAAEKSIANTENNWEAFDAKMKIIDRNIMIIKHNNGLLDRRNDVIRKLRTGEMSPEEAQIIMNETDKQFKRILK